MRGSAPAFAAARARWEQGFSGGFLRARKRTRRFFAHFNNVPHYRDEIWHCQQKTAKSARPQGAKKPAYLWHEKPRRPQGGQNPRLAKKQKTDQKPRKP
jgi:hypothetical protein